MDRIHFSRSFSANKLLQVLHELNWKSNNGAKIDLPDQVSKHAKLIGYFFSINQLESNNPGLKKFPMEPGMSLLTTNMADFSV